MTDEPETERFTVRVGADARLYGDIIVVAVSADAAVEAIRAKLEGGCLDFTYDEMQGDGANPTVIYVRDESGNDSCELIDLVVPDFDIPPPVIGVQPYDKPDIGTQFRLLRALIGTTSPLGSQDMREILNHIEATLSPYTYRKNVLKL